ncbi:MAG: hypothetical protein H0W25_17360 [Acidimicrobiia bacterium]|nr:hypothetical protein [Acidimicrobiia bacterium]
MSFGQSSGPPASAKQVQYLLALVNKAGHTSFRDARGPLGLTQRQAGGKFTGSEASALIDRLLSEGEGDDDAGPGGPDGAQVTAADRLDAERLDILRGMPAGLLAGELEQRGWTVTAP